MKTPIDFDKGQLLIHKSVRDLKENLSVGEVVCYFERKSPNPMLRFGIVKSFLKRCGTEFVVITDICSDLSTFDISIELLEYNFIVGLNMDTIYNYWTERIEKQIEVVKNELKSIKQRLHVLKKSSHLSKRRFKNFVDSLQNEEHIPN